MTQSVGRHQLIIQTHTKLCYDDASQQLGWPELLILGPSLCITITSAT